ncbi:DUF1569 domain-containing protein [Ferruginibacter albus]|uniref:DUF1569 domain-containing protein n=1 Tax=Ferruginibacter albus TaxID=2875540 RepID=UPI001CC7D928|nr:DUF1569 domain-containing protein [Ferruginibacter albus]UAY52150.1 DUF1569 domain-containing protein [Ferruginibacter albus]
MKSLFDNSTYTEIKERLNKLSEQSPRQWGKMDVAQMMAHCIEAFKIPLSDLAYPRMILGRVIGFMFKSQLYNDKVWKQGLPTSPDFIIKDQRNFTEEKQQLITLVDKFYSAGPMKAGNHPHPFFGKFTKEQWGQMMYKHLDHHLRQFGV